MMSKINRYAREQGALQDDEFMTEIGRRFIANVPLAAVATATTVDVGILPSATKEMHVNLKCRANQGVQSISLIEAPTGVTGGSAITSANKNRNSAATVSADLAIKNAVTGATGGTTLWTKRVTGAYETDLAGVKMILKAGVQYVLRCLTGASGSNEIDYTLDFYENLPNNVDRSQA
jgi:hypothetical protein